MSTIEEAFRALQGSTLDQRMALLQMLVERWYGPIEPDDGYAAEDLGTDVMPRTLRWWLTTVGGKRIFSQNHQRSRPLEVRENGMLVFLVENQGCFELGCPVEGDDPPVWSREAPAMKWMREDVPLSIALLHMMGVEIVLSAPYTAWSAIGSSEGDWLATRLIEAKVPGFEVPLAPSRIFAREDLVAIVFSGGGGWIGAKQESQLDFLEERGDEWERVDRV